jgi:DNA invertase Pin-like site-specific DNA recombinase
MKYKELQAKYNEVTGASAIGLKREVLIEALEAHGVVIEGEKMAYVHEAVVEEQEMVFKSISAHIRYLFDDGMKQSAIAKKLQVRDQFVSNVVRKYKAEKVESEE